MFIAQFLECVTMLDTVGFFIFVTLQRLITLKILFSTRLESFKFARTTNVGQLCEKMQIQS